MDLERLKIDFALIYIHLNYATMLRSSDKRCKLVHRELAKPIVKFLYEHHIHLMQCISNPPMRHQFEMIDEFGRHISFHYNQNTLRGGDYYEGTVSEIILDGILTTFDGLMV